MPQIGLLLKERLKVMPKQFMRVISKQLTNEWKRMRAWTVSDIYYDKFLINGANEVNFLNLSR
jgi:hypothetical protein